MKIIDFHTHIYPDKIAERATVAIGNFYNLQMERVGSLDTLLESMDKSGIDKCVVHSVATSAQQVERINDFIKAEVDAHSDKLYGFGTMHQDYENKIEEAKRIMDMGLKGIPVLLHCGDYRYDFSHPRRVAKICKMFPDLQVIGAHFGGWSVWEEAYEYLKDTNCMLDTSSSSALTGPELFEKLIKSYGADRLLFGTDFPMWDSTEELKRFMNVRISEEEREKILYKNAEKILKI